MPGPPQIFFPLFPTEFFEVGFFWPPWLKRLNLFIVSFWGKKIEKKRLEINRKEAFLDCKKYRNFA